MNSLINYFIGGFLFLEYHFYFFILVAIVSLLSAYVTYRYIKESLNIHTITAGADNSKVSIWSSYVVVLKDYKYMIYLVACFLVFSFESHLTNFIAIHLKDTIIESSLFGLLTINGVNMVGILHAENTIIVVFFVGMISWMMKKVTDERQYFIGMALFVISYSILSYISSPIWLLVMMLFISIGELMYVPVNQSLLADLINETHRSSYLAVYGFVGQGQMIFAGFAITISSKLTSLTMSTILLFIGIFGILLMRYVIRSQRKEQIPKEISAVH